MWLTQPVGFIDEFARKAYNQSMETARQVVYRSYRATVNDLDLVMRAQLASHFEIDQLDRQEVALGLASGKLECHMLVGPKSQMCVCVQREGHKALLAGFYREGDPCGLAREANILWSKLVDTLQMGGIIEVCAYVHRDNPRRDKLMRFYHRLGFKWSMVKISRSI